MKTIFDQVENIDGKGENAGFQNVFKTIFPMIV